MADTTNDIANQNIESTQSKQIVDDGSLLSLTVAEATYWEQRALEAIEDFKAGRCITYEEFKKKYNWK